MSFQDVQKSFRRFEERKLWTDIQDAVLGNGETPPEVIIPPSKRQDDIRVFWAHQDPQENKSVFAVANAYPGLPYNNHVAGLSIQVGYPPNSRILSIYDVDRAELARLTGGPALPIQAAIEQIRMVTPDRVQLLKLEPYSGLVGRILPGVWRSGNTPVTVTEQILVDFTSLLPGSGNLVWVLVSISDENAVTLTAGTEYATSTTVSRDDQLPKTVPDGEHMIAWVRLLNTTTDLENAKIINLHDAPILGGGLGELGLLYVNSYGGFMRTSDGGFLRGAG